MPKPVYIHTAFSLAALLFCIALTVYFLVYLQISTAFMHLFYLPIVLFSAWWKRRGIILTSILIISIFVINFIYAPQFSIYDNAVRSACFLFISALTGFLFERRDKIVKDLKLQKLKVDRTLDGIGDMLFILDNSQKVIRVNKAACKVLDKKPEELLGKHCYEVVHGTRGPWANCPAVQTIDRNQTVTEEISDPKLGKTFIVTTSPVVDEEGKIIECIHSAKDITEIKATQEELNIAGELFDSASDSLLVHDLDGRILFFNEAAHIMRGYTKEEFQSLNVKDLQASENPLHLDEIIKHLMDKKEGTFVLLNVRKDKTVFPIELHSHIIESEGKKLVLSAGRDVTERKKFEEDLANSESKYRTLVENADDAILLSDLNGNTIYRNPAYFRQLGFSEGESDVFARLHPDDLPIVRERMKTLLKTGFSTTEYRVMHHNGSWVNRFSRSTLIYNQRHTPYAILSVIRDITEQKLAEQKLVDGQEKIALINEKLRVVGSLTRHDVRNKLSGLNGYLYILRKMYPNESELIDKINKMVQSVKDVERIFEFARLYEKIGSEELTFVNVGKSVDAAIALFSDSAPTVVNDCSDIFVLADSFLSQMFYNFIDNTRKHGKNATAIRISCERYEHELKLIYEDNGVGISQENKMNLFKEGFSTAGTSGYGLFLIKKMIQVYGWQISEIGLPSQGVKFVITIPEQNWKGQLTYR